MTYLTAFAQNPVHGDGVVIQAGEWLILFSSRSSVAIFDQALSTDKKL